MSTYSSVSLSLKQIVKSLFFIFDNIKTKTLNVNFTLGIILNRYSISTLLISWNITDQIKHQFIVDFKIAHSHSVFLFKLSSYLLEHLGYSSWNDSSVLIVLGASIHGECLTSSCLTIDHYSAIKSLCY
jgi:hypothetical protein